MKLISSDLNKAINEQIGHEFSAMLQYVNIATYFDGDALPRLAAHFYRQAEEEKDHAMRLVHYVVEAGGTVTIPATPGTRSAFASAADAVQLALDQEITVTQQINALMDLAIKENDHAAQIMLTWFVTEQIEEVSSMESLLSMIKRAGDSGLLFVEQFLASAPAAAAE
jgi:ferritin